jgi:hypothetical protein
VRFERLVTERKVDRGGFAGARDEVVSSQSSCLFLPNAV